jgi:hypothetical protein
MFTQGYLLIIDKTKFKKETKWALMNPCRANEMNFQLSSDPLEPFEKKKF